MFNLDEFLTQIVKENVSDIHLRMNEVPIIRKNGIMLRTDGHPLTLQDLENIEEKIIPGILKNNINNIYSCDFLYEIPSVSRFRVNYAKSLQTPMFVFRTISYTVPTFKERRIPSSLENFCSYPNGMILVTGPTGSGKSTTITTMLEHINTHYNKHIVTLEDPVEFLFENKRSIFSQRTIGIDAKDFSSGVKAALRQDPDIIFIGEIRDRETAAEALNAAETGHLVFATMHTSDAIQTINRIVDFFEPFERPQLRAQLAHILRATIAQKLLPSIDGKSRVPAFEILISTPTIEDYIKKDELGRIYELIREGRYADMVTLNLYLATLIKERLVSEETALEFSENKDELKQLLKGTYVLGNKRVDLFK